MKLSIREYHPGIYGAALFIEVFALLVLIHFCFFAPKEQRPVDMAALRYQSTEAYLEDYISYIVRKDGSHTVWACEGHVNYMYEDTYVQHVKITGLGLNDRQGTKIEIYFDPKYLQNVMTPKVRNQKLLILGGFGLAGIADIVMILITLAALLKKLHKMKHPVVIEEHDVAAPNVDFYTSYEPEENSTESDNETRDNQ